MRVSQKTEYGIRAMVALAKAYSDSLSSKEIAEKESIPETFLEQILVDLKRAELLESIRGPYGGYRLKEAPENIGLDKIISTLEGTLSPARCEPGCEKIDCCSTRSVLDSIEKSITGTLEGISLKDLIGDLIHE